MSKTRTWQDNAAEFALLDKGEGWPFARLIACSVRKGAGEGGSHHRNDRYGGKVSAQEFARQAETSAPRVLRYLDAWDRAAEQGLCTPSADLGPSDAPTVMEPDIAWGQVYDASKSGGRPRDSKAGDAAEIIDRRGAAEVVDSLTKQQRNAMAAELRRKQAEDNASAAEEIAQGELERGVSNIEGARLQDYAEARNKLVEPIWQAYHHLGFAVGDWEEYKRRLGPTDLASMRDGVQGIRDHLAVLDMYLTDDIVGEVLNHE